LLSAGFRKDFAVRQFLQSFVSKMFDVVAFGSQPFRHTVRYSHIGKKSHAAYLTSKDLLMGKPCRVFQRLPDVLPFKIRIIL